MAADVPGVRDRPGLGAPRQRPRQPLAGRRRDAGGPQLNRRFDRATRREPVYDDLIREKLAQDRLVSGAPRPVRLPPERFDWAEEQAQEWIDWLAASGVDVIGDAEDLRPVRPAEGERWRNPDKVKVKVQLKATLDALAAMTEEAASRPDPQRRLVTRARTHAGRLRLR